MIDKKKFGSFAAPCIFLMPQILIVLIFFYVPSTYAVLSSLYVQDSFGLGEIFVGLDNYEAVLKAPEYWGSALFTLWSTILIVLCSLVFSMILAITVDNIVRGAKTYKAFFMWGYAIAPPVAGLLGTMLFDQNVGPISIFASMLGWNMKVGINYFDTAFALIIVAVWKQISVNFIFILAGLQAIPPQINEAALIDCRSPMRRFWTITFPLLAPTTFFLVTINITYALFGTFGAVDVMTGGEPSNNPIPLAYKIYLDGFRDHDLGGSSAQSVILMVFVLVLTIFQFRFIERRVHYA